MSAVIFGVQKKALGSLSLESWASCEPSDTVLGDQFQSLARATSPFHC